jgi:hypothetical protein
MFPAFNLEAGVGALSQVSFRSVDEVALDDKDRNGCRQETGDDQGPGR